MTKVVVCGIFGRMGTTVARAVNDAPDLELVGGIEANIDGRSYMPLDDADIVVYTSVEEAIEALSPDVMVDFTHPSAVEDNVRTALRLGVNCVVGTTGLSEETLSSMAKDATENAALFFAPNFTTGAVLMMSFAAAAARFFPDIEIIEFHHDGKADSPSGTAVQTAKLIAQQRNQASDAPGKETENPGMEGARGALVDGVPVHSVRTAGHVAHQEVILGSSGQTLTIRHDSIDRSSYMPGVLLAVRKVEQLTGLVIGLDKLMEL